MMGSLSTLLTKTSILCFYLRFSFCRCFRITLYILMAIVVVANLLPAFTFLVACQPISHDWDIAEEGVCINLNAWYTWNVIFNCVTDGVLLLLPAWMLRPLKVACAQKGALAAILGLGGA